MDDSPLSDAPPPDLHGKLNAETPRFSVGDAVGGISRAFGASKRLQQMLGLQDPEPFVRPPEVPRGLEEKFKEGLKEYGWNRGVWRVGNVKNDTVRGGGNLEEMEKLRETGVQAMDGKRYISLDNNSDGGFGGQIAVNKAYTGQANVPPANRTLTHLNSSRDSVSNTKNGDGAIDSLNFGSGTTLVKKQPSRAENLANTAYSFMPATLHNYSSSSRYMPGNTMGNSVASSGTLFPSPHVGKQSWGAADTDSKAAPPGVSHQPRSSQDTFLANLFTVSRAPVPNINIQVPSPKKPLKARKRGPSTSGENTFGPPLSKARAEDSSGLPILPADAEALWKFKFPGNTYALLTVLLNWSQVMWKMYRQLPDAKFFSIHPAFPYPVTAPLQKRLVSVSFYDTSVEPHKEIRFIGPGDVAQITYNEVDTFKNQDETETEGTSKKQGGRIGGLTKNSKLGDELSKRDIRSLAVHQLATTGEGRWAYILIQGHKSTDGGTPPHIIITWHVSATTDISTCMHTILSTGSSRIPQPTNPMTPLKRFSALQNPSSVLCASRRQLHQALRSPSSAELPTINEASLKPQDGAQTLQRTVMKFQKAGGVPLIEGFRVDVAAFRAWLDAAGRGQGKIITWA